MTDTHEHANVLGIGLSAVNMNLMLELAERWLAKTRQGYICFTGVHGVMEAQKDPRLRDILNQATMNAPDGMPMAWVGHLQGFAEMDRVSGPDFMLAMCSHSLEHGYRHFLYGGKPGVAVELKQALEAKCPGIQIVGTYTPPFRPLNAGEEQALISQLRDAKPHILWVGLSTPKQELFMDQYLDRLQVPLLVGVGAAFDFHTGRISDCSNWIKRAGMQWFHRMMQDPVRLGRRYFRSNPAFVWKIILQLLRVRHYPIVTRS
jgi:N-acetylglucosaminyldiphosphoundecaprenol N-acetyl-beta-D-mannosaminyltransferase